MRGPNYWSVNRCKLIVMKLDIEELEEIPTNKIEGFKERLQALLPGLYEHRCSEGKEGGFLLRVDEGTWMGHVIEHIALEIQTQAGMDCGFGRTRSTGKKGIYNVVFTYTEEEAGHYAAYAAVRIAQALIQGEKYDLQKDLDTLQEIKERTAMGPSTRSIVEEAVKRDIPFMRLNDGAFVQLGYGKNQVRFRATMTDRTSSIASDIASNKEETKELLEKAGVPVPAGLCISSTKEVDDAIAAIGFPMVMKPYDRNHGKGVTINIETREGALAAFEHASKFSHRILAEKFIRGYDFRVLMINYKFIAASLREPAHVTGNGRSTIRELIELENKDPRRGHGHQNVLTEITADDETYQLLRKKNYTLDTVLEKDELCYLKGTANLSTGGTATDVTDEVHPSNIAMFERVARIIGLDICGVDVMGPNLSEPLSRNGSAVLEVNAAPGFRMHFAPTKGKARNVAAPVVDMLFPDGKTGRIPIISVTGTNGKTTTTRLIAHIVRSKGYQVGYTTSDGIYIDNDMLSKGDTTGPDSARFILKDPTVDFAVLETARGGILRAGLAFDKCDVAVVTNVQEDHMGLSDINTPEDMAKVKRVIIETVKPHGYAILNADNKYCVSMSEHANGRVAYFSMSENNPVVREHCRAGGIAAFYDNDYLVIKQGSWKFRVNKISNIPLTFNGRVLFMMHNVLAATLAAYAYGFEAGHIGKCLESFVPSAEQTPGRMNIFNFRDYTVMIDYAHNVDGFKGVREFLKTIESPMKIGIITGTGDRRDEDIRDLGRLSATMFDHIIIRQDKHLRGRTEEEIVKLLVEGIKEINPNQSYEYIPREVEALKHAFGIAKPGAFITALSDVIENAIDTVHSYLEKEKVLQVV